MNNTKEIEHRISEWEKYYKKVVDRTTPAYLDLLNSMRDDYEKIGNEEKCIKICKEIQNVIFDNKYDTLKKGEELLLESYDSMARCGDFRAYCIALEWNRPIEKQFFLPRKKILEKHGLIQAMQDMVDDKLDFLFVSLPPRIGKLVSNSTPILTKKGWKKHGDLQVGDYVLNHKGRFVRVLATSPEYPCNCRVTFSNGEQIDCHENHEWLLHDARYHKDGIFETKNLINNLKKLNGNNRFFLPVREPILGEHKDLQVDPYVLGSWLGDGSNRQPRITCSNNDKIIADTIEEKGYPIMSIFIDKRTGAYTYSFDNLTKALHNYGMCYDEYRTEKHIPEEYFTASMEQRLELLAGLIDTDGYIYQNRYRYSFSTLSERLRDDVIKLVSTFGWRCSVFFKTSKEHTVKKTGHVIRGGSVTYNVEFNVTYPIPCRVERKKCNKCAIKPGKKIAIKNIEKIENGEMGKCIQVEGGVYLAGKTLLPTHNSTLGLFLLTYMAGLHPERSILGNGHSTSLTQSFYNEILNVITGEEYRYGNIFPTITVKNKSAEYSWIDLNTDKRFHTLMFRSLEGATTGLAEASNILYCDDLIKDIETAESPARLDKIFYTYTSTVQDRKVQRKCKDGVYRPCPEIHIATRWSINDPIGRLIRIYDGENNPRVRIINIPCYDENGESNFLYDYGKGFNKEYYQQLQKTEDPITFRAKYLGEPMERTGHPFTKDNLSFYTELPSDEPDRVLSCADPSFGGKDYFSAPIAYQYGNEIYIEDVYYRNNVDIDISRRELLDKLMKHKVTRLGIEKNNGGLEYSELLTNDARSKGYRINITTHNAPPTKSKRDRILSCQSEIKGIAINESTYRIYFKADKERENNEQYNLFMRHIYEWSEAEGGVQKTQKDDCIDSVASMLINVLNANRKVGVVKVGKLEW